MYSSLAYTLGPRIETITDISYNIAGTVSDNDFT